MASDVWEMFCAAIAWAARRGHEETIQLLAITEGDGTLPFPAAAADNSPRAPPRDARSSVATRCTIGSRESDFLVWHGGGAHVSSAPCTCLQVAPLFAYLLGWFHAAT